MPDSDFEPMIWDTFRESSARAEESLKVFAARALEVQRAAGSLMQATHGGRVLRNGVAGEWVCQRCGAESMDLEILAGVRCDG